MILLLLLTLLLAFAPGAEAQTLSSKERAIARRIPAQQAADIALLERVVNLNSGTLNVAGVRAVGRMFQLELERLGFTARWEPLPDSLHRAGHLIAERKGRAGRGRRLLLLGHLDTVFEPDSPFQRFERQDTLVRGPGVNDMKGALVMIISALKALKGEGALDGATITVALMGDEESIGEPVSVARAALVEAAKRSDVVLGFEGSTFTEAVVARRGFTGWKLVAHGKQAHSQGIFTDGNGAIYELARILDGFYREVRGERYLTFNPGVMLGGSEVGQGTSFKIYLPRYTGPDDVMATPDRRSSRDTGAGKRILVVEDDAAVRSSVRRMLERHRFEVVEAPSADGAVATLEASVEAIDLVISDMVMPGLSGLELRQRIRAIRPGLPVLLMSGYSEEAITRLGNDATVGPLIEKPFTVDGMLQKVRETLRAGRAG